MLLLLLWAQRADAAKVAILETTGSSAALSEAVFRLQGELLAVGIEVEIAGRPRPDARGMRATLAEVCAQRRLEAVVDVVGVEVPEAMEVWAFEPTRRTLELWRVLPSANAPSASLNLAIKTSETIRSNLVERGLLKREAPPADNARSLAGEPALAPGSAAPQGRASVDAGVALLTSLQGIGPAVMPLVQVGWNLHPALLVQATVAGLGTRPTLRAAVGSAKVDQSFASLGLRYCWWCAGRVSPFASLALGVERTSLVGDAALPAVAHAPSSTAFLVDAGVGLAFRLSASCFVAVGGHLQVTEPRAVVHFADTVVARAGRPNIALDLTLGLWP